MSYRPKLQTHGKMAATPPWTQGGVRDAKLSSGSVWMLTACAEKSTPSLSPRYLGLKTTPIQRPSLWRLAQLYNKYRELSFMFCGFSIRTKVTPGFSALCVFPFPCHPTQVHPLSCAGCTHLEETQARGYINSRTVPLQIQQLKTSFPQIQHLHR